MGIQKIIIAIFIALCTTVTFQFSPEKHVEHVRKILTSIDENSCTNTYCQAFEDAETHDNFINIFQNLHEILQDLSHETLRNRLRNKSSKNTTDVLFHFLISNPTQQQIQTFINQRLNEKNNSSKITGHRIVKRSIGDTIVNAVKWVVDKLSNADWRTIVKRAGQAFGIIQAVRGVTDPSQVALNAGLAVGKAIVIEAVEDKISDAFKG